jgi:DNA-directed RNA polymerase sigma subunit (sigma70/sigma32)
VIDEHDQDGMSRLEVARAFGVTHQTVAGIERRALGKLRRLAKRDPAWRETVADLLERCGA